MKKLLFSLLLASILFISSSCKKSGGSSTNTTATFQATVNGTVETFNVTSSTLLRSATYNQKRLDITGVSTDQKYRFIITLGDETALGNDFSTGDHVIRLFNTDNPATTTIDESIDTDAYYTLSTLTSNGGSVTDVYAENGDVIISANTVNGASGIVTATFQATLVSKTGLTSYTITNGSLKNISYTVMN